MAGEPSDGMRYSVDEALALAAVLRDAIDVLSQGDHLAAVIAAQHQLRTLTRKLEFGEP